MISRFLCVILRGALIVYSFPIVLGLLFALDETDILGPAWVTGLMILTCITLVALLLIWVPAPIKNLHFKEIQELSHGFLRPQFIPSANLHAIYRTQRKASIEAGDSIIETWCTYYNKVNNLFTFSHAGQYQVFEGLLPDLNPQEFLETFSFGLYGLEPMYARNLSDENKPYMLAYTHRDNLYEASQRLDLKPEVINSNIVVTTDDIATRIKAFALMAASHYLHSTNYNLETAIGDIEQVTKTYSMVLADSTISAQNLFYWAKAELLDGQEIILNG